VEDPPESEAEKPYPIAVEKTFKELKP
jgi:hypothetical protein